MYYVSTNTCYYSSHITMLPLTYFFGSINILHGSLNNILIRKMWEMACVNVKTLIRFFLLLPRLSSSISCFTSAGIINQYNCWPKQSQLPPTQLLFQIELKKPIFSLVRANMIHSYVSIHLLNQSSPHYI